MATNPVAFKGVYKISLPNVKEAKTDQEKAAYTDVAMNTIVMAANNSVAPPRVDNKTKNIYFKINDKNDAQFEAGFKQILDMCNKNLKMDMSKKVYVQKVSEDEFNKAEPLK